jgi:hypothetical protein
MQECLIQVETQQDHPLDKILVQYVKIQLIADKAIKAASHDANVDPDDGLQPPPSLFAQEMLTQLKSLKSTMVDTTAQDGESKLHNAFLQSPHNGFITDTALDAVIIQLQLHAAEISINEIALRGDPTMIRQPDKHRTRHLYACTQAIKEWCDVFLAIPIPDINGITCSNLMQMRHIMGLLYILSTIDEPGWTKDDAAAIVDLFTMLDRLANNFSQVPASIDFQGDIDTVNYDDHWWTHVASTVRTLRTIWSGQDWRGNAAPGASSAVAVGEMINLEGIDFDIPGLDWLMDPVMMTYTG